MVEGDGGGAAVVLRLSWLTGLQRRREAEVWSLREIPAAQPARRGLTDKDKDGHQDSQTTNCGTECNLGLKQI